MEKLKQTLKEIKGKSVDIHIRHRLFGKDNIKCDKFTPVIENGAGFKIGDQMIYIKYNDIDFYEIKKHHVIINGNNFSIEIKGKY